MVYFGSIVHSLYPDFYSIVHPVEIMNSWYVWDWIGYNSMATTSTQHTAYLRSTFSIYLIIINAAT